MKEASGKVSDITEEVRETLGTVGESAVVETAADGVDGGHRRRRRHWQGPRDGWMVDAE
jgi:hypothetical protein